MAKRIIPLPSQAELHELFEYRDGKLYWKVDRHTKKCKGEKAGTVGKKGFLEGYTCVILGGVSYLAHRLIYKMHTNTEPPLIDHYRRELPEFDNSIENLREGCKKTNAHNAKKRRTNTSGFKNVYQDKKTKKWYVQIQISGTPKRFCYYEDIELADLVAQEARDKFLGEWANHG